MGKRGPKPKPTAVRILEGNLGRMPINEAEPEISGPPRKTHEVAMDEIASNEWELVVAAMPAGVYSAGDSAVLAEYAMARSFIVRARLDIEEHGQLLQEPILNRSGAVVGHRLKENPAFRTWRAAHAALMQTTDRLGLSPGVRSRLSDPSKLATGKNSKFGDLIG